MNGRLRVGFPPEVSKYPASSGTGKVWCEVLAKLADLVDLQRANPHGYWGRLRRRFPHRLHTWIHDGHQGPLPVREPVVTELHEAAWDKPETLNHVASAFIEQYAKLSEQAAQAATMIVTLSESSKRQIVDAYGVPEARVVVAPPGVEHRVFHPEVGDAATVLGRAGGDPARPYVLFASQLHPRKNLAALRTAMTRLVDRGFPHQLVIVGGFPSDRRPDEKLIRAAAADLPGTQGRVVHLRDLTENELAQVMAGAAAFCLPSFMEGFGLTVLEAMACGAPVIVSDRGSLPEVVGDAGVVVAPDDEAIEDALADVLTDAARADALGRAAIARSRTFTWSATAAAWYQALAAAADRR